VPRKFLKENISFIPEGSGTPMSVVRVDSFSPIKWCLYYDLKCKDFVTVSYNDSTYVMSERFHCKVQTETAIAINELFTTAVASSSYLADCLFFDGIIYDMEVMGYNAFTLKDESQSNGLTDIIDTIINYTSKGEGRKIDKMRPIIKSLSEKYRSFYTMPNKNSFLEPLSQDFF